MRRYVAVQKARDADVFGILVGTLGVGTSACYKVSHCITLFVTCSVLPAVDNTSTITPCTRSQEELHCDCGKTEPRKAG